MSAKMAPSRKARAGGRSLTYKERVAHGYTCCTFWSEESTFAAMDALAEKWKCTRTAAIERAVLEMFISEFEQSPNPNKRAGKP